jgi:hypothetical protein
MNSSLRTRLLVLRLRPVVSLFRFKFHFISHFSEISLTGFPKPEMTHPWQVQLKLLINHRSMYHKKNYKLQSV